MDINRDHILKLAKLANLELNDSQIESYIKDINRVLELVSDINDIDTDGVVELANVLDDNSDYQEDELRDLIGRDDVLGNAPDTDGVYFQVPPTITHNKEKK